MEDDMPTEVKVVFDLTQGQWADLHDMEKPKNQYDVWPLHDRVEWLGADKTELLFGRLPGGIKEAGASPAVIIRANRPDGSVVLIETSLGVFVKAAEMMKTLDDAEQQTNDALKRAH
jgi:hypothetical protein